MKLFEMQSAKPLTFTEDQIDEYTKWFESRTDAYDSPYTFFDGVTDSTNNDVDVLVEPYDFEPKEPDVGIMHENINYSIVAYGNHTNDDNLVITENGDIELSSKSDDYIREQLLENMHTMQSDHAAEKAEYDRDTKQDRDY